MLAKDFFFLFFFLSQLLTVDFLFCTFLFLGILHQYKFIFFVCILLGLKSRISSLARRKKLSNKQGYRERSKNLSTSKWESVLQRTFSSFWRR